MMFQDQSNIEVGEDHTGSPAGDIIDPLSLFNFHLPADDTLTQDTFENANVESKTGLATRDLAEGEENQETPDTTVPEQLEDSDDGQRIKENCLQNTDEESSRLNGEFDEENGVCSLYSEEKGENNIQLGDIDEEDDPEANTDLAGDRQEEGTRSDDESVHSQQRNDTGADSDDAALDEVMIDNLSPSSAVIPSDNKNTETYELKENYIEIAEVQAGTSHHNEQETQATHAFESVEEHEEDKEEGDGEEEQASHTFESKDEETKARNRVELKEHEDDETQVSHTFESKEGEEETKTSHIIEPHEQEEEEDEEEEAQISHKLSSKEEEEEAQISHTLSSKEQEEEEAQISHTLSPKGQEEEEGEEEAQISHRLSAKGQEEEINASNIVESKEQEETQVSQRVESSVSDRKLDKVDCKLDEKNPESCTGEISDDDSESGLKLVIEETMHIDPKTDLSQFTKNDQELRNNLPSSPIQLSDDSDVEITGESQATSIRRKLQEPKHIERSLSNDEAFKTSLQCVYSKGQYVCKSCSGTSRSYVQFAQHVYRHLHGKFQTPQNDCPYCKKERYAVLRPLSCPLVTQLMGVLQKQKRAQDLANQTPSPFDGYRSALPVDKTAPKHYQGSTDQQITPDLNDWSSSANKHTNDGFSNGEKEFVSSPVETDPSLDPDLAPKPIVIEPTTENDVETAVTSTFSNAPTGDITPESPFGSNSVSVTLLTRTTSKDLNKVQEENPRLERRRYPIVKCRLKDKHFVCERCGYSVCFHKPKTFRRHLWFEVHPVKSIPCDHCPESVKYNRFMACPVINGIMSYLLESKAREVEEAEGKRVYVHKIKTQSITFDGWRIRDREVYAKGLTAPMLIEKKILQIGDSDDNSSDSSLLDVVNENDGGSHSHRYKPYKGPKPRGIMLRDRRNSSKSSSPRSSVTEEGTGKSKMGLPSENNFTDVIAMIQGLNANVPSSKDFTLEVDNQGKNVNQHVVEETGGNNATADLSPGRQGSELPGDNTRAKSETASSNLFVISSVVSQADEIQQGDTRTEQLNENTEDVTIKINERDKDDAVQQEDRDVPEIPNDCDSPDSNRFNVRETCLEDQDVEMQSTPNGNLYFSGPQQSGGKSGKFLYNSEKVSRTWPFTWNKTRSVGNPGGEPEATKTGSTYTCPFYKCMLWNSQDSSSFKIHNLLHHSEAKLFPCAYCFKAFATDEYLMQHVGTTHRESRLYVFFRHYHCGKKDCTAAFEKEEDYVSHNIMIHPKDQSFSCSFCLKEFESQLELLAHIKDSITYTNTVHGDQTRNSYQDMLDYVESVTEHQPQLADSFIHLHIKCCTHHVNGQELYVAINRSVNNDSATSVQSPGEHDTFKCTICSLITSDEEHFESHIKYCKKYPNLQVKKLSASVPEPPPLFNEKVNTPEISHNTPGQSHVSLRSSSSESRNGQRAHGIKIKLEKPDLTPDLSKGLRKKYEGYQVETGMERAGDDDSDSLPELDPPILHPQTRVPVKSVMQGLGRGSPVPCEKCSFSSEFRVIKAIHDRLHTYKQDKAKMLWCPHCPYSTDDVLHLKIHAQGHLERSRIRLYHCGYCPVFSNQVDIVEDHHEDIHGNLELKSEVKRLVIEDLPCTDCSSILKTETELLEHLEDVHGHNAVQKYLKDMYSIASLQVVNDDQENERDEEPEVPEVPSTSFEKPEEGELPYSSIDNSAVITHDFSETDDAEMASNRFQCPNCKYSCYKCGTWVRHMQRHHIRGSQQVKLYCCKTCKWKSTFKRKTIDHCRMKHNEIILEVQTMEFSNLKPAPTVKKTSCAENLEQSIDPVGISRYHCDFCDFSTNERVQLTNHWKTHEGQTALGMMDHNNEEENYEEDNLHSLDQSGPLAEMEQDITYTSETIHLIDDMLMQLQDDEGKPTRQPIRCPVCPYTTELRKCMRRHMCFHKKQANIENGFKCSYCPYASELEGVVTRHINKHHPDLPAKKIIIGYPKARDMDQSTRGSMSAKSSSVNESHSTERGQFRTAQQCPKCNYRTNIQQDLVVHMAEHMQPSSNKCLPGEFTIASVVGGDGSTSMISREGAEFDRSSKSTPKNRPNKRDFDDDCLPLFCSRVDGKDLYRCLVCVFMDQDPAKIYHHFCSRHVNHCPVQCGYCLYRSVAVVKIQQHCKINHGDHPVKVLEASTGKVIEAPATKETTEGGIPLDLIEDESTLDDECREQAYDDLLSNFMIKCGNGVQMCKRCGYEQKCLEALKRHVLAVHLRHYPYKCKHCAFSAVEVDKVLKHTDKEHPDLERKIICRKIPDDLPPAVDCDEEGPKTELSTYAGKVKNEQAPNLNIRIKQEPISSPEPETQIEESLDDLASAFDTSDRGNLNLESIHVKKEPEEETIEANLSSSAKLSRRQKYPKQYTKTYRCMECSYLSRWNLADVKHHVLTVHLKVHPYSCRRCCYGTPKRGRLEEHYEEFHPGYKINPDEVRDELQTALRVFEEDNVVCIGLGENAPMIAKKYPQNVKARTTKMSDGGQQKGSSSRYSSPAPGTASPLSDYSPASRRSPSKTVITPNHLRKAASTTEQPLDLSCRTTPPLLQHYSSPGYGNQAAPTTLRVPNIPKPYSAYPPGLRSPTQIKKKPKKREYTLYKCSSCGRGYVQKIKGQYHYAMKHVNLNPYICNYCSFGENTRKKVVDHIMLHHPDREVVVFPAFREHSLVQGKVYPVKVDLSEYEGAMRAVKYINDAGVLHPREKSEKCTVRCPQCSMMMPNLDALDYHLRSSHRDYTGFKCCYCGVYVKAKQKMRYHLSHKHPDMVPKYQPIKEGVPFGGPLSTFDEILRKKSQFHVPQRPMSSTSKLNVTFPFYRLKQEKIGFANISKKRLSARCSRGYRENTGTLVDDVSLQMRVPTQPTPEEVIIEGRPPPKMIKPRSDVVGGTVWLLCNHCQYTTLTSTLMRHHVMSHINYRPFKCAYCSFVGVRSHQVKKHMVSMHRKLPPLVKYQTDPEIEGTLTDHFTMKVRKGNQRDPPENSSGLKSGLSRSATVNKRVSSGGIGAEDPVPLKKLKVEEQVSVEKEDESYDGKAEESQTGSRCPETYACVLCGFQRPSRSSLLRHIMWELDYRPWTCPHCEYKDVTLFGVKRHCFQFHPKLQFKMVLKQNPERMAKIQALVEQSKVSTVPEKPLTSPTMVKKESLEQGLAYSGNTDLGLNQPVSSCGENVYEAGMMMAVPSDNTIVTSAEQLEAQEQQQTRDPHKYKCKHCTFQSLDKTCFKKHILRHGPKRFQCGYCSYCAVFKAELHRHMNRLHKRKPYKIIALADNQIITTKAKMKPFPVPIVRSNFLTAQASAEPPLMLAGHSVDPKAEGGVLAQLEAELEEMKSGNDYGSDDEPEPGAESSLKEEELEESGMQGADAFAVLDGVVLTEEQLKMNAQGEFECQFCGLSSIFREKARTHVGKHFQLRWKCGHCSLKHQLSYEMRRHIRSKHPGYPIKMFRLETDGDFVSKSSVMEQHVNTPGQKETLYSRPGPACSKWKQPSTGSLPSVFCCFLCTYKTNDTSELVAHQKTHADSDKMPTLSPEGVAGQHNIHQRSAPSSTSGRSVDGEGGRSAPQFVRPFKCGHCDHTGFVRAKIKKHCMRMHKDLPVHVIDQRWPNLGSTEPLVGLRPLDCVDASTQENNTNDNINSLNDISADDDGMNVDDKANMIENTINMDSKRGIKREDIGERNLSIEYDKFLVVTAVDVLKMPQTQLEQLLKVNYLKGIRW